MFTLNSLIYQIQCKYLIPVEINEFSLPDIQKLSYYFCRPYIEG